MHCLCGDVAGKYTQALPDWLVGGIETDVRKVGTPIELVSLSGPPSATDLGSGSRRKAPQFGKRTCPQQASARCYGLRIWLVTLQCKRPGLCFRRVSSSIGYRNAMLHWFQSCCQPPRHSIRYPSIREEFEVSERYPWHLAEDSSSIPDWFSTELRAVAKVLGPELEPVSKTTFDGLLKYSNLNSSPFESESRESWQHDQAFSSSGWLGPSAG